MHASQKAYDLIKHFEGLRLTAYRCPAGKLTIGYGSTRSVKEGMKIDQKEADLRLAEDVRVAEKAILRLVKVALSQGQLDALVSFTFNLGAGNLAESTLLRRVNESRFTEAANELMRWTKESGKVSNGLVRRRSVERDLFVSGRLKM